MSVKVVFTGDAKQLESESAKAEKAISGVGNAADDAGKKSGGFASALKGASTVAGGFVLGSAITKAPGFLLDAAKAAAEDEQATARLDQALRNAGGSFDDNKAKIDARIASGAKLAFSDDDVRDSFQTLLTATGDVDEALRRQTLAMDLARGGNMTLEQASKMVGKVNEENVDGFKKLGINIADGATEQEALAAVQGKFAGQADTYANSSAAQMERFNQQMGELQETIGSAVLPILTAFGALLADVVVPALSTIAEDVAPKIAGVLQPAIEGVGAAFQAIQPFMEPILAALGAFALVILTAMVPAIAAWTVATWAQVAAQIAAAASFIAANAPVIALAAVIALLAAGIVLLIQHWGDIEAKYPIIGQISDALKEKFEAFIAFIRDPFLPAVQSIYDKISTVVGDVVTFVVAHWHEVWDTIEPVLKLVGDGVQLYFGIVQTTVETVINAVRDIINIVMGLLTGDWDRAWNGLKDLVNDVWEGIKKIASDAINFIETDLVPLMLAAATKLGGALRDGFIEALKGAVGIAGDIARAIGQLMQDAVNSVIDKINEGIPDSIPIKFAPDIDLPDNPLGHISLPGLAAGGVTTGATAAIVGESGPEAIIPLSAGNIVVDTLMKMADLLDKSAGFLFEIFHDIDSYLPEIWLWTGRLSDALAGGGEGAAPAVAAAPAAPAPQAPTPTTASPGGGKAEETVDLGAVIASGRAEDHLKAIQISATDIATDVDYLSEMLNNSYKMVDALTDIATDVDYNSELLNNSYKTLDVLNLIANILDVGFKAVARGLDIDHLIDATQRRQADGWAA